MLRSLTHARRRLAAPIRCSSHPGRAPTPRTFASRPQSHARLESDRPTDIHRRFLSSTPPAPARIPFKLHDIGEGITEVEMLKWKVAEGDRVDHFDDLCEVQSDKSTAELTSPTPGIVVSINVHEGDTVKVGQTLCVIDDGEGGEESAEEIAPVVEDSTPPIVPEYVAPEAPAVAKSSSPLDGTHEAYSAGSSNSSAGAQSSETGQTPAGFAQVRLDGLDSEAGPGMSTGVQFTGEASILPSARPTRPSPGRHAHAPVEVRRERNEASESKPVTLASPAVRTLAGRLGIDLSDVSGSGERGRVTREDVERYTGSTSTGGSTTSSSGSALVPPGNRSQWPETTRVEFGRTRKVMYRALGAQAEVPHFGYSHTLNLTPLLPYLKAANGEAKAGKYKAGYLAADIPATLVGDPVAPAAEAQKTTLLTFLVKAMLLAMEEHPIMRAKVVGDSEKERALEIRRDGVVGVAVSDPKYGLLTPSLPALEPSTPLPAITSHLAAARAQPTRPGGQSANVVISSVGGLGESTGAMPVIPPNGPLAICAVGRAKWVVEWTHADAGMKTTPEEVERGGTRAVLRCPVGWSGDHRVLEGAELIAFTESWKKYIEEPWRWIKVDG